MRNQRDEQVKKVNDKQLRLHLELLLTMDALQTQILFSRIENLPDEYLAIKKAGIKVS